MKLFASLLAILFFAACNNNNNPSNTEMQNDSNNVVINNDSNNIVRRTDSININTGNNNTTADKLIIPGEKIGKALLNTNADSLEILFGKPDMSDAAMGKAWLTWYGKKRDEHNNKTELDIYTAYKDTSMREKTVQQIRTTSSYFHTENDIHVYGSLSEVRKAFPQMHKVKQSAEDEKKMLVFDDVQNGIAFEFENETGQKMCTGIFVHGKGKKVTDVYIVPPSE